MYPEPHIPSAPSERAVDGEFKLSGLSVRTRFALGGGMASLLLFLFVIFLSAGAMTLAKSIDEDEIQKGTVISDPCESVADPHFSTRMHPTRLP